jgi:hypothetical protein
VYNCVHNCGGRCGRCVVGVWSVCGRCVVDRPPDDYPINHGLPNCSELKLQNCQLERRLASGFSSDTFTRVSHPILQVHVRPRREVAPTFSDWL